MLNGKGGAGDKAGNGEETGAIFIKDEQGEDEGRMLHQELEGMETEAGNL